MRGGTSKAVFLREDDLPIDPAVREWTILRIFGSPDKRQVDGLGGADPLTSKLAIIGTPSPEQREAGISLTYTFGQVEIEQPRVDWHSLCGNISSAVGAYAVREGMVSATEPLTHVRVHNTNLNRVLTIEVPTSGGVPLEEGDYVVPGVPGSGARILVDFADTAGGATGSLLPTGNPMDTIDVPGFGKLDVSLVDIGNAHVFLRASDLGLTGTEAASEIDARKDLRDLLERIRGTAAERIGLISAAERSRQESPATPLLAMVGTPSQYTVDLTGAVVEADDVDMVSRLMFMQQMHKTYAGTSTVCTGVAARIAGTVVHGVARPRDPVALRIGHPAGVIVTESIVRAAGDRLDVRRATLGRTARLILEGNVMVSDVGRPVAP
jgi:2-methylaconitate cis-trans-isomerase PrpF